MSVPKPKIYITPNDDKTFCISAFPSDAPEWERNHMVVREVGCAPTCPVSTSMNIMRNVLCAADTVQAILE